MKINLKNFESKIFWKHMRMFLPAIIVLWAVIAGVQITLDITAHNFIGVACISAIALFLVALVFVYDYWTIKLMEIMYKDRDSMLKVVRHLANELVALHNIALCAMAMQTSIEKGLVPNTGALKHYLEIYEMMRPKENEKPN